MKTMQFFRPVSACFSLMLAVAAPLVHAEPACDSRLIEGGTKALIQCADEGAGLDHPTVITQEAGLWVHKDTMGAFDSGQFQSEADWDSSPGIQTLPAQGTLLFWGPSQTNLRLIVGKGNANQMTGNIQFSNDFSVNRLTINSSEASGQKNNSDIYQINSNELSINTLHINFFPVPIENFLVLLGSNSSEIQVNGLFSPLSILNGDGPTRIWIGEGTTSLVTSPIDINKRGKGSISLVIDDSKDTIDRSVSYSPNAIEGLLSGAITWNAIDSVALLLGKGDDVVQTTNPDHVAVPPYRDSTIVLGEGNNQCSISGELLSGFSFNNIVSGSGNDVFTVSAIPSSSNVWLQINGGAGKDHLQYSGGLFQIITAQGNPEQGHLIPIDSSQQGITFDSIENF